MKKDLLWPSAPGSKPDVPGGTAGFLRGAAFEDHQGRIAPTVSILSAPTKFRDAFERFDTTNRWNVVQVAAGDIVQLDGNVAGASYLVISKDPRSEETETVIETIDRFAMPMRVSAGISLSQRINGQEFAFELVSTDDAPGELPLPAAPPVRHHSTGTQFDSLCVHAAGGRESSPFGRARYEGPQFRQHLRPGGEVEIEAWRPRGVRQQSRDERASVDEWPGDRFKFIGQAQAVDGGAELHVGVVDDDAAIHRDIEILAGLLELPAVEAAA
jgi:hypothetical protein